jgi:hypothetical protein
MSMRRPKDLGGQPLVGRVRLARTLSNVISPPVIFAALGLAIALYERPDPVGLLWAAVYGFWVSLMPILLVLYLLRTGRVADLHLSSTDERRLPYLVGVLGAVVAYLLIWLSGGPPLLATLALLSVITLGSLAIITRIWLISVHATSISGATVVSGLVFGKWAALVLLPVALFVFWLRLYLRRHNVGEIVAGAALGASAAGLIFLLSDL